MGCCSRCGEAYQHFELTKGAAQCVRDLRRHSARQNMSLVLSPTPAQPPGIEKSPSVSTQRKNMTLSIWVYRSCCSPPTLCRSHLEVFHVDRLLSNIRVVPNLFVQLKPEYQFGEAPKIKRTKQRPAFIFCTCWCKQESPGVGGA